MSLEDRLSMEHSGDIVNSQFEVHTLADEEPDIECIHVEKWAIDRAKQQIFKDLMEMLVDEETPENLLGYVGHRWDAEALGEIEGRNQLRQELRTKIKEYVGIE